MSYEPGKMSMVVVGPFTDPLAPQFWCYHGDDAVGDVDGTDYVTNASDLGMRVRDMVWVKGSTAPALMYVSAIDSDGNGTLTDITT